MYFLFFGIPAAAVMFFAISLFRFCYAKYKNKKNPGSYSVGQIKTRKVLLIVSSVIAGLLAAIIIGFIILLMTAVAFM